MEDQTEHMRESILWVQIDAALQEHDLTPFEPVDNRGYQATCRRCGKSVWVAESGLMYSILSDSCPDEVPNILNSGA